MSSVSGSCAANARAAALSIKVMAKRRLPTVIHMRDSSERDGGSGPASPPLPSTSSASSTTLSFCQTRGL
jgi:hypothetical protein